MKNDLEMMENMRLRLSCLIIVTISNKMTERRSCDVICVNERIFVRSFVKPKNIRLLGFDIRFTTNVFPPGGSKDASLSLSPYVSYRNVRTYSPRVVASRLLSRVGFLS